MRKVLITVYIVSMILVAYSHAVLPDDVAIHFNARGEADGWAPKMMNTALFGGLFTMLFLVFLAIPKLLVTLPPKWVNLPNKEYWLSEENLDDTIEMFGDLMDEFGAAILGFFAIVTALTTEANRSTPVQLDNSMFFSTLVVFFLYSAWWCFRLYRDFRLPPSP